MHCRNSKIDSAKLKHVVIPLLACSFFQCCEIFYSCAFVMTYNCCLYKYAFRTFSTKSRKTHASRGSVCGKRSCQPRVKPCFAEAEISKGRRVSHKFPGGGRVSNLDLISALRMLHLMLALNRSLMNYNKRCENVCNRSLLYEFSM
jgi:hypothetical protein